MGEVRELAVASAPHDTELNNHPLWLMSQGVCVCGGGMKEHLFELPQRICCQEGAQARARP